MSISVVAAYAFMFLLFLLAISFFCYITFETMCELFGAKKGLLATGGIVVLLGMLVWSVVIVSKHEHLMKKNQTQAEATNGNP